MHKDAGDHGQRRDSLGLGESIPLSDEVHREIIDMAASVDLVEAGK